jgi:hypothetical protein
LSSQPYFFSEGTVFFSRNKSANNTFQLVFSAKRVPRKWEPHHRADLDIVRSSEHGGAVFFFSCNNCCHVLITHVSCQTTIGRNLQRK